MVAMGNEGFCLGMCQPCCHPVTFTLMCLSLEIVARGVEVPPSRKPQCELEPLVSEQHHGRAVEEAPRVWPGPARSP